MRSMLVIGFALLLGACVADAEDVEIDDGLGEPAAPAPAATARANIQIILLDDHFDDSSRGDWDQHGTQDQAHNDGVFIGMGKLWMMGLHKSWVTYVYSFHHTSPQEPWLCRLALKVVPVVGSENFRARLKVVDTITRKTIVNVAFPDNLPLNETTTVTTGWWREPASGAVDLSVIHDNQTAGSWIVADDARLTCTGVNLQDALGQ